MTAFVVKLPNTGSNGIGRWRIGNPTGDIVFHNDIAPIIETTSSLRSTMVVRGPFGARVAGSSPVVDLNERLYGEEAAVELRQTRVTVTNFCCSAFIIPSWRNWVDSSDLGSDAARRAGSSPAVGTNTMEKLMDEIKEEEFEAQKKIPTYEEEMTAKLQETLNYNLAVRREQGIDPKPVIVGWQHIYNTYNSEERERWQKTGYARTSIFKPFRG